MFSDRAEITKHKNNPTYSWVILQFEKEKSDIVKRICATNTDRQAEKLLNLQGQLVLVEQALQNLK